MVEILEHMLRNLLQAHYASSEISRLRIPLALLVKIDEANN